MCLTKALRWADACSSSWNILAPLNTQCLLNHLEVLYVPETATTSNYYSGFYAVSSAGRQVKDRLKKMGHLHPLNIFLRQEIDRMQRVVTTVRSTLKDLKLAIDGTIIMSENLRDALDSMYDARIPGTWKRVCIN